MRIPLVPSRARGSPEGPKRAYFGVWRGPKWGKLCSYMYSITRARARRANPRHVTNKTVQFRGISRKGRYLDPIWPLFGPPNQRWRWGISPKLPQRNIMDHNTYAPIMGVINGSEQVPIMDLLQGRILYLYIWIYRYSDDIVYHTLGTTPLYYIYYVYHVEYVYGQCMHSVYSVHNIYS